MVAVDADINQHLAEALGAAVQPPPLGAHLAQIKEYLRGTNPRIASAAAMVKTTPPGRGSRLLRPGGSDPVHDLAVDTPCGAMLLATGPFSDDDLGVACTTPRPARSSCTSTTSSTAPASTWWSTARPARSRSHRGCSPGST